MPAVQKRVHASRLSPREAGIKSSRHALFINLPDGAFDTSPFTEDPTGVPPTSFDPDGPKPHSHPIAMSL
jgi:hypothetical protein